MTKPTAQDVEITLPFYDVGKAFEQAKGVVQGERLVDGHWRKLTLVEVVYLWRNDPSDLRGTFHFKFLAEPY